MSVIWSIIGIEIIVLLCLIIVKKTVMEFNSGSQSGSRDVNFDPFITPVSATPFPTSTPHPSMDPAILGAKSDATSIELEWVSYDYEKYRVEITNVTNNIKHTRNVTGGKTTFSGLQSNSAYDIVIYYDESGEVYGKQSDIKTAASGVGDPFKSVDTILTVAGVSKTVTMTSESGSLNAKVWPQHDVKIYKDAELKSEQASFKGGTPLNITGDANNQYCYLRSNGRWSLYVTDSAGKEGWMDADLAFVDLTDLFGTHENIYGIQINRTNAESSIFTAGGSAYSVDLSSLEGTRYSILDNNGTIFRDFGYNGIKGVTGKKLANYGDKNQMPVLWDLALELLVCQKNAMERGTSLLIYEGYRPKQTSLDVSASIINNKYLSIVYNKKDLATGFLPGTYSWGYYIAQNSSHNKGTAVDLTLMKYADFDRLGDEVQMQTKIHTLDFRSNLSYNNEYAKMLAQIMKTNTHLKDLISEWWHFELDGNTKYFPMYNKYIYADYQM